MYMQCPVFSVMACAGWSLQAVKTSRRQGKRRALASFNSGSTGGAGRSLAVKGKGRAADRENEHVGRDTRPCQLVQEVEGHLAFLAQLRKAPASQNSRLARLR